MNFKAHINRKTTSGGNKNHHQPESRTMNSKKGKSVINILTRLCQRKKKEADIFPIPDKCGYGAALREDVDPLFEKSPLVLYKVLFEVDTKNKSRFAFYSHVNSWSFTEDANIGNLVSLIRLVEGIKV